MKPKIAICIPSKDEWKADTAMCFGAMMATIHDRYTLALLNRKASMISDQRNELTRLALELNVDYLFWFDTDLKFPPDAIDRLLAHGKDIVGATYNKRTPPYETLGHFKGPPRDISGGGLIEADYLPGGMMLVRADVLRSLTYPWFFETYHWAGENQFDSFMHMLDMNIIASMPESLRSEIYSLKGLRPWLEAQKSSPFFNNRVISEDINFCRKAVLAGYEIWCDLDLTFKIEHIGEYAVPCAPERKLRVVNG